jgi:FKBP-type peptidyl-prolyl cis-trans isomerase (trigger factor)
VRTALERRLVGRIPDEMYGEARDSLMRSITDQLAQRGLSLEEYCEKYDVAPDIFNMNVFMQASEYLRQNLALDTLAELKGIHANAKEWEELKENLPQNLVKMTDEELLRCGVKTSAEELLKRRKALAWLLETVVIRNGEKNTRSSNANARVYI